MRFSIILIIGLIMLWSVNIVSADDSLLDNDHYVIVGHIYEPYSEDNQVVLTNMQTGEQLRVTAIKCEHGLQEYLFNLANLHQGWTYDDEFIINYGSEFIHFKIIKDSIKYQQDIQRPNDIDPIFIFTGFLIIAVGSGYFYMKKKKQIIEGDKETMTDEPRTEIVSIAERVVVLLIFGALAGFSAYSGNQEAAAGYASTIAVYFLARQGV